MPNRDIQTLKIKERYGKARIGLGGGVILCECGRKVAHILSRCLCEQDEDHGKKE